MAFVDNSKFVISQIRHSCVTSDDTGMSEIVIVNEETENEKLLERRKIGNWGNSDLIGNYSNSFDIDVSPIINSGDFPRKEIIEKSYPTSNKNSDTKCKNVTWKDAKNIELDPSDAFNKKEVRHHDKQDGKQHGSLLSKTIEKSLNQPKNPFASYGKFDGEGYARTNKVRLFKIFFPQTSKGSIQPPMSVCLIVNAAQVQDLVGLIMFKYTQQGRKPELQDDVKSYCLLIADELDGEIDFDLPALDSKELISKFDFKALALSIIQKEEEPETIEKPKAKTDIIVEVCEEKQGSSKFTVDKLDLCMKVVMEKMLKKRNLKRTGREYVLVKKDDPENAIDLEETLESMNTLEFRLVKRASIHSAKKDSDKNGKAIPDFFTSAQYKSFKVSMLHRFGTTTDAQLGIHKNTIEIQQATQSGQRTFLSRAPKAVTIEMENVVNADVLKTSGNRSMFRIIYSHGKQLFKNYDFECPQDMAAEIVHKIELILDSLPNSESRIEYQKTKVKDKRGKKS